MSHNITSTDTVISVRDAGWHGLAKVKADYVTPEEARQEAFPWEPVTTPLYRAEPVILDDGTIETRYVEIEGTVGVERSDNGEFFGAVSSEYGETLASTNNKALTQVAESIEGIDAGDVRVETAGSLKGGRKVWMLLRLAEPLHITGDPHGTTIPYYALQTSHDGSGAFRGQALFTRVICDNTAQAADLEAQQRGTEFVFRHTASVGERIEEAKTALSMWRQNVLHWNEQMQELIEIPVTPVMRREFVERFIPAPVSENSISKRVQTNIANARSEMFRLLGDGNVTTEGINDTAYGLVQAAVEFQQHVRGVRGKTELARMESRFNRAYLTRDNMTTVAIDLAREVALAA